MRDHPLGRSMQETNAEVSFDRVTKEISMASYASTDVLTAAQPRAARQQGRKKPIAEIDEGRLARFLGWFSIGLGVAEVVAPRTVARLVGTRNNSGLIRCYGLREIASGVGIL